MTLAAPYGKYRGERGRKLTHPSVPRRIPALFLSRDSDGQRSLATCHAEAAQDVRARARERVRDLRLPPLEPLRRHRHRDRGKGSERVADGDAGGADAG